MMRQCCAMRAVLATTGYLHATQNTNARYQYHHHNGQSLKHPYSAPYTTNSSTMLVDKKVNRDDAWYESFASVELTARPLSAAFIWAVS